MKYDFHMKIFKNILTAIVLFFTIFSTRAQQKYTFTDSGFIFHEAPFKECHASTLADLGNGNILCSWFGGTQERNPDVVIWSAVFNGSTWSTPTTIADGVINDSLRYPCWNPVLYKNKQGTLFLFYKIGPSPAEWWGVYKTSDDNGKSWSKKMDMPEGILGAIKNKPISYKNKVLSPTSTESINHKRWQSFVEISDDDFNNFIQMPIDTSSKAKVIQPTLLTYAGGNIQALLRSDQNKILQSWSYDGGNSWSAITATNLMNPNSGIDAVTLSNHTQMLVYNPQNSGSDWWDGRSKLNVAISKDGVNWQDVLILENKQKGEYSYPAIIQASNGSIYISYTYDRKKIKYFIIKNN